MFRSLKNYWLQQKAQKGIFSENIKKYVLKNTQNKAFSENLSQIRFLVFDTETTGLDFKKDNVISVAAVGVVGERICIADSVEIGIKNTHTGKKESVLIHQIRPEDLDQATNELQAVEQFLDFIGSAVLVAHHAYFDMQLFSKLTQKYFGFPLLNAYIDTHRLAIRLEKGHFSDEFIQKNEFTLDSLCQRYHIENMIRHNAAGDALATAQLFQILLKKAQKNGVKKLNELAQYL